jgi:hypothetical protein
VIRWLDAPALGDLPPNVRARKLDEVLAGLDELRTVLEHFGARQADALLADHRRVRQAAGARGRYDVRALTPVDVIAAGILLPPA